MQPDLIDSHYSRQSGKDISAPSSLPTKTDPSAPLQREDGKFYFLVGYSQVGGEDILR